MLKPKAVIVANAGVYLAALYPALMGAVFSLGFELAAEPEDLVEGNLGANADTGLSLIRTKTLFYSMATFPIVAALCIALAWSLYKIRAKKLAIYISFIPWINIVLFVFAGLWTLGS